MQLEKQKKLKIYLASSWKNAQWVYNNALHLRKRGYDVDAFVDTSTGRYVFNWREIVKNKDLLDAKIFLEDSRAQRAFKEDKKWLDWCNCLILMLPAGKSSHLEAGYIKGQGKSLIIYALQTFEIGEFDVMYGFADLLTDDYYEVINFLERLNGKYNEN